MKDNHGWGLRAELLICLILTVFFAIAVVLIGRVVNTLNEDININKDNNSEIIQDNNKNGVIISEENNGTTNDNNVETNNYGVSNEESVNYNSLEDKLVSAGVLYANKYYKDSQLTVTVVRLQTENMLNELIVEDTKCSGYVEIEKDETFKYYPYIKCGDKYETNGYDEVKDNTDL